MFCSKYGYRVLLSQGEHTGRRGFAADDYYAFDLKHYSINETIVKTFLKIYENLKFRLENEFHFVYILVNR